MKIRLENIDYLPVNFLKGSKSIYFSLSSLIMMLKFQWNHLSCLYVGFFYPQRKIYLPEIIKKHYCSQKTILCLFLRHMCHILMYLVRFNQSCWCMWDMIQFHMIRIASFDIPPCDIEGQIANNSKQTKTFYCIKNILEEQK